MKYFSIILLSVIILASCKSGNEKVANLSPNAHQVKALEVLQTSGYTYVRVQDDNRDYWLACNSMAVKVGETYFWSQGSPMNDFKSKELNRTFPVLFLVQDFTDKPILANQQAAQQDMRAASMAGRQQAPEKTGISVPKTDGGITIAELYSKRSSYGGKEVKIRGEVIKFSKEIMKRNWVHIQDGTKDGVNYDLAVTTLDSVQVGQVVVFKGVISLNRDFGAGYSYEVIMENAVPVK
ncbi:MAG: GW dipeptide domain-containing protein [Bacteroidota bacterium]